MKWQGHENSYKRRRTQWENKKQHIKIYIYEKWKQLRINKDRPKQKMMKKLIKKNIFCVCGGCGITRIIDCSGACHASLRLLDTFAQCCYFIASLIHRRRVCALRLVILSFYKRARGFSGQCTRDTAGIRRHLNGAQPLETDTADAMCSRTACKICARPKPVLRLTSVLARVQQLPSARSLLWTL